MAAATKSAIKLSEAEIQKKVVSYINAVCPGAIIIANPFSELQLAGSDRYRWTVLGNAKAKGWEKSQPDLIVLTSERNFAIEIKTDDNDPFRKMRGGGMWIKESKSKHREHVLAQAQYLSRLSKQKGFGFAAFGSGYDQCIEIVNRSLLKGFEPKCKIFTTVLQGGKYTPNNFFIRYLDKNR